MSISIQHFYFVGRYLYTVYIISDSYIGFDQQYDIQFEVIDGKELQAPNADFDYPDLYLDK